MRLIDADALLEFIENRYEITWECDTYEGGIKDACTDIIEKIDNLPTIEERKTGKWVNNIHDLPVCDQCGYMTPYDRAIDDYEYGNFCPNCGADMRGEQDGSD